MAMEVSLKNVVEDRKITSKSPVPVLSSHHYQSQHKSSKSQLQTAAQDTSSAQYSS
jgi:hypothetical protein